MAYAAIQRKGKGQTSGATISIGAGDGWATPTSGNLLVVTANSDATVSTPAGYTAGPSVVDGNGAYIFWKVSAGTESTVTCTPGASVPIAITCAEYSGNTASPLDVSNSSTVSGSAGTSTTSVSVTTTVDADLIVAAACLHSGLGNMTGGSWSNSFVNQITASSGGATSADVVTFVGELLSASPAGAYSTVASWTNNASDRQELVIAFKAAAVAASGPTAGPFPGPGPARFAPNGTWSPWAGTGGTGPQLFLQNLAGSVTPTGALQKAVTKPGLAGAVTPTGALAKQVNKALAGSVTATGVLATVKVVLRSFTGSVTPTGALAKQVNKALAGSSTATGTLTRQVAKALAGSVTPSGALAKSVAKAFGGSVTPTGVLSTTKVLVRSFAGSVTPTGVLARQANKALAGSVTPTSAVARAVAKALAGAVAAAGAAAKLVGKPLSGRSTPTGSVTPVIPQATAPGYLTSMTTTAGTASRTTASGSATTGTRAGQSTTTTAGGG